MLQTVLWTVLGVDDQVPEELVHVRLENVPEVYRIVDLGEYQHEVLQVSTLVGLLVWGVQVVVVKDFKDLESVLEDTWEDLALIGGEVALVGHDVVNGFQRLELKRAVGVRILGQERLCDFVGQDDALLEQFGLDLFHVQSVVGKLDGMAVEA